MYCRARYVTRTLTGCIAAREICYKTRALIACIAVRERKRERERYVTGTLIDLLEREICYKDIDWLYCRLICYKEIDWLYCRERYITRTMIGSIAERYVYSAVCAGVPSVGSSYYCTLCARGLLCKYSSIKIKRQVPC